MNVIFRTDSSLEIGSGHVMRCLTLAQALRDQGSKCLFICREHNGNLLDLIRERGFETKTLPVQIISWAKTDQQYTTSKNIIEYEEWLGSDWQTDAEQTKHAIGNTIADWLVVDHYGIDLKWESTLKPNYQRLLVVDDLADRSHICDLLLDQSFGRTPDHYKNLLPDNCKTLLGSQYALLRPEFSRFRKYSLMRRPKATLQRLLISMGGIDKNNVSGDILEALDDCLLPDNLIITVVMGRHSPWLDQIHKQASQMKRSTKVLVNVENMAKLMTESDLAIGAAGSTTWERCCLGLPTITVTIASNQLFIAKELESATKVKAVKTETLKEDLKAFFNEVVLSKNLLGEISSRAGIITNGLGTSIVLKNLLKGSSR